MGCIHTLWRKPEIEKQKYLAIVHDVVMVIASLHEKLFWNVLVPGEEIEITHEMIWLKDFFFPKEYLISEYYSLDGQERTDCMYKTEAHTNFVCMLLVCVAYRLPETEVYLSVDEQDWNLIQKWFLTSFPNRAFPRNVFLERGQKQWKKK